MNIPHSGSGCDELEQKVWPVPTGLFVRIIPQQEPNAITVYHRLNINIILSHYLPLDTVH